MCVAIVWSRRKVVIGTLKVIDGLMAWMFRPHGEFIS